MKYSPSTLMLSWFKDRYLDGTLKIKPPYQRKPIWTAKQKCYLVESILLGLPVPEIYIQQVTTVEGKSTHAIVDGQQRIRTVLQFVGAEIDPDEAKYNKFALDKLEPGSPWSNRTFADLTDLEKQNFFSYVFAVRYLQTDSDREVRDMFGRLNRYLTPLNAQELRNAIFTGPFIKLANSLADNEYWTENRIVTPALIRRMVDMEFMSELLIGVMHGPQAGSAKDVDEYYEKYEDYESEFPGQREAHKLFTSTLEAIELVLPNIKKTRWANKTDFYTLFVALASKLRTGVLPKARQKTLARTLEAFADEVNQRLADEKARVSEHAVEYVRAVEKGANDKKRRADRQAALLAEIGGCFTVRRAGI